MSVARLSLQARRLQRSGIREVFTRAARIPEVISLAVGEPLETAEPHVVEASERAVRAGLTRYTDALGVEEFRQAAADYTWRHKGLDYSPVTQTQVIPGATLGLYLSFAAILDRGDEVLVPSPAFTSYDAQISLAGGVAVHVGLRPENGMGVSADDLAAAITPRTRAIMLNSPSNPIGSVTPMSELVRIAALAERHDLWIVADEVYHAFVHAGHGAIAPSIASVPGAAERTIIVESLSKTFAMTGWRIGYLHGPRHLIEQTATIAELMHSSINAPAQYAAVAALNGPSDSVLARGETYRRHADLVLEGLQAIPSLSVIRPEGAFYAFVDVRRTGLDSGEFSRRLLEECRVAVIPGEAFGAAGRGFVRVSYAGEETQLREGIERLVEFSLDLAGDRQLKVAAS